MPCLPQSPHSLLFHPREYFPHMLQNIILMCSVHLNYFINRTPLNEGLLNFEIHVILHSITLRIFVQFQLRSKGERFSVVPQGLSGSLSERDKCTTAVQALLPRSRSHTQTISLSTVCDSKVNEQVLLCIWLLSLHMLFWRSILCVSIACSCLLLCSIPWYEYSTPQLVYPCCCWQLFLVRSFWGGFYEKTYYTYLCERLFVDTHISHFHILRERIKRQTRSANKHWRGCRKKGTLLQCWWECKLLQPTIEDSMEVP